MDDLISRQAAICIASGYCHPANIAKELAKLPSAQPERKKGEWLPIIGSNEFGEPYQAGVYCSECGFQSCSVDNYCPNCGADMRESR